jgi:hypothetical protein
MAISKKISPLRSKLRELEDDQLNLCKEKWKIEERLQGFILVSPAKAVTKQRVRPKKLTLPDSVSDLLSEAGLLEEFEKYAEKS